MKSNCLAVACGLLAMAVNPVGAHTASSGQDYTKFRQRNGLPCCGGRDCRPVSYKMRPDGSVIMFPEGRVVVVEPRLLNEKFSEDGRAHWCGVVGPDGYTRTYCAILPRQMTWWKVPLDLGVMFGNAFAHSTGNSSDIETVAEGSQAHICRGAP